MNKKRLSVVLVILTLDLDSFAVFEGLVLERQVELLRVEFGEAAHDHLGVRENDAVHGEAGALDRVLVHFY